MPNLIITPHTAWISRESRQRLVNEIALNIEAYKTGEVRNRVV
jgi:glycerate dehydrogenase